MSLTTPCPSRHEARSVTGDSLAWVGCQVCSCREAGWEPWGRLGQGEEEGRAQEGYRPHRGSQTSPGCLSPIKLPCPASRSPAGAPPSPGLC